MDKIDRLLQAIERPDQYSDREREALLADPEIRKIYDMLCMTKSSLQPIIPPDVDAEWNIFECARRKHGFRWQDIFSRKIAASMVIAIGSLAAVAAVVGISVNYARTQKSEIAAGGETAVINEKAGTDTAIIEEETTPVTPEIIIFDNEELEAIVNRIAAYYGYMTRFSDDASKSLRLYFRWNQTQTLDEVVESLNNFEQIHLTVKDKTIKID